MEHITVNEIVDAVNGILLCGDPDTPLKHISIDSRVMKGDDLFVPLIGERADGHCFIDQAFSNQAAATLTSEHETMDSKKPWIRVKDTKKALQDIGSYYRKKLKVPLIGITGSVGKTTTREMVACALSADYQVYKTPGNHNSQVGVPICITEISRKDQIGVIELGMSEPDELTVIAKLASIQMAVITNVGVTHIEQLGSVEAILNEKLSIQDGLEAGGILFLNGDDEHLKHVSARPEYRTIYYGTGSNCDYRAVNIKIEDGYPSFLAVCGQESAPVSLTVRGEHNILNALVSIAVARENGISMEHGAEALKKFNGFKGRQQVLDVDGIKIIDDSYNASPVSMKAGIDVLRAMPQEKRKIAVLADMKELGKDALAYHFEIGEYIADHPVDLLICFGNLAQEIARGVQVNHSNIPIELIQDKEALISCLEKNLSKGDCVLFKGSNSMKLGDIVSYFTGKKMH